MKYFTFQSPCGVPAALIIRKQVFFSFHFFFVYKILLSCPYPGPVWCGESKQSAARNYLVITKAPMHIQKFGGQTKQLPWFSSSELLPLLLSCQISIGSKFCINDDDDWEILIYQTCPPRQQIIFKAAQEHNATVSNFAFW